MIYQHKFFTLNTDTKTVFDENNKILRITGNSYRVLVFLCESKSATVSEIGNYLDWAKDYDENNIRQYRHKINTVIGHDIIKYYNGVYSIIDDVKVIKDADKNIRNTDLLQGSDVKSKAEREEKVNIMKQTKDIKLSTIPAILGSILLLLALFKWPYGFYTFLKIVVTGISIYYGYYLYKVIKNLDFWFWVLVIVVIMFNPLFPIYLSDKALWNVIDVVTAIFLISFIIKFRK